MPTYASAAGSVELEIGDDVTIDIADTSMEGGIRRVMGQVTTIREGEEAVWVRGVRIDLADATVVSRVPTDDPANLTPPPAS